MSEYNFNSVFKVPTLPLRHRKPNCNNTQSTYNNAVDSQNSDRAVHSFKKIEEEFEVIKKICSPDEVEKVLKDVSNQLHSICYYKVAEMIGSSSQPSSVYNGGVSAWPSTSSVRVQQPHASRSNYGSSTLNAPDRNQHQNYSSQSNGNNYGLLNMPVSDYIPSNIRCPEYSNVEAAPVEPCGTSRRQIIPQVRQRKNIRRAKERTEEEEEEVEEEETESLYVPVRKNKENSKKKSLMNCELQVLPSDSESDSLSAFFKGRKKTVKASAAQTTKKNPTTLNTMTSSRRLSISVSRVDVVSEPKISSSTRKLRKRNVATQPIEGPSNKKQQLNSTSSKNNRSDTAATGKSQHNVSASKKRKSDIVVTKTKKVVVNKDKSTVCKSKSKKIDKNSKEPIEPTQENAKEQDSTCAFDLLNDGSFFGDVSSINGIESLHLSSNTFVKNATKHSIENRNEMPFFSPYANVRSTSGFSGISTPLSKSTAKNVLSKRIKKPNVVAEFKGERIHKTKKSSIKNDFIRPIEPDNKSSDQESETEVSDFSD